METISRTSYVSVVKKQPCSYAHNLSMKRTFDFVFSLIVLFLIFPIVFIVVALLIKYSSPGPIFFKQKRTGLDGADFYCYKFRTMVVNKEADTLQAHANDPRKTKIGDFLRQTNIDELPQFINVLKGEMSVVGPRPHMLKHTYDYSALIANYMDRHVMKPGITGWAQVNGLRGETRRLEQMVNRVNADLWYIENWSLGLDLKIILYTICSFVKPDKNAY